MATSKPISTVSYNSESFLNSVLNDLYSRHIIQAYQYIKHIGEDGDKNHIHLRLDLNKRVDPMDLTVLFKEFEPGNSKPLCVRPWRPSKEEDWFLYVVHDKKYLQLKYGGGDPHEKIPYNWNEIIVSDDYDLQCAFIRAKSKLDHTSSSIARKLKCGAKPIDLIEEGEDVFVVNGIMKTLREHDYDRVLRQCNQYHDEVIRLKKILDSLGVKY